MDVSEGSTSDLNDWIYVYFIQDNKLYYDRAVSRTGLGPSRAKQLVPSTKLVVVSPSTLSVV